MATSEQAASIIASLATLPADVWANNQRTLTQVAAAVIAAVSGSTLTIQAWDNWSATLSGLTIPAHTKMWLVIKSLREDNDDGSLVFLEKTAGLTRVNKAAYGTATDGTLTVGASSVVMQLKGDATALLPQMDGALYALKVERTSDGEPQTIASGKCNMDWGVARVMS